ncbi:sodium/glutamate symporter [Sporosalibacterium faouarense]|uniref:sodium/glutamate symporter n=1 Tax=Sporosalibacterium faouarense TaxID=516123 RepID=UPI00141CC8B1|nr:sodium/glutamate symporter [Sporosalibacterium faouarense]MTI46624.1 sodium:glutamate symporter [Bacillota bacterium]
MNNAWTIVIDFTWLALFIIIANILKSRIKALKKFIIPTSVIAGFIGLILGPEILKIIPFDGERFGTIVYHLMAIGFIAISLKDRNTKKKSKTILNSGIHIVTTYLVQGIVGFGIALILFYTVFPDLFVSFGLLLPLGFGQGPGQAYSIGSSWEAIGLTDGGNIGLTIATFGFLWASIIGVPLMNYLVKKNKIKKHDENIHKNHVKIKEEMEPEEIPLSESLDKISIQLSLIGIVYLATYLSLTGITKALEPMGTFGQTLSQLLWGFHFNIGAVYGILMRFIFNKLKQKEIIMHSYPNNYLLQRIAGGSFDFMITASIAAISIYTLKVFVVPIILVTTLGGIITAGYTIFMCKKLFKENTLENIVGFYGMQTGTISTGMALLKAVDPHFDSDAAENLVIGSAVALAFGFPLMLVLNIPIVGYVNNQPIMYLYTMLALIGYLLFLYFLLYLKNRQRS